MSVFKYCAPSDSRSEYSIANAESALIGAGYTEETLIEMLLPADCSLVSSLGPPSGLTGGEQEKVALMLTETTLPDTIIKRVLDNNDLGRTLSTLLRKNEDGLVRVHGTLQKLP